MKFIIHAGSSRGAVKAVSIVSNFLCMSVCPRSKRKTDRAANTKIGKCILHGRPAVWIDVDVKRSKVTVTRLSNALRAWVCRSIRLHIL